MQNAVMSMIVVATDWTSRQILINITKLQTQWLRFKINLRHSKIINIKDIKNDKTEFLENQSRRKSVRVDGIPDNDKSPGQVQK